MVTNGGEHAREWNGKTRELAWTPLIETAKKCTQNVKQRPRSHIDLLNLFSLDLGVDLLLGLFSAQRRKDTLA